MLDWPPKSHTCILMFLYSTDSTLNPIAGSVRARTGNRRNHLSQLQAVQDSSLSCAVQPQHQNTHRRTPPPEPERIVQRRERHAHPCAVRGAYRRREGISRDYDGVRHTAAPFAAPRQCSGCLCKKSIQREDANGRRCAHAVRRQWFAAPISSCGSVARRTWDS